MATSDVEILHVFLMLRDLRNKTIFMCHGNAENMSHRLPIADKFYHDFGWKVFIFSYRGHLPGPLLAER